MTQATEPSGLSNHFLISTPQLKSSEFGQSVIYICEHNESGSMGLKINHTLDIHLSEMLAQLKIPCESTTTLNKPILDGGPVNVQQGFILHNQTDRWENSLKVAEQLYVTTSKDILYEIASDTIADDYLVVLGYSGWSPGQLENELKDNAWMTIPATTEMIFNPDKDSIWQQCVDQLGFDLSQLSSVSGNA